MPDLRTFTLSARDLLTKEAGEMLQQVYRLDVQTGARLPIPQGHMLHNSAEATAIRARIEKLLDDEVDAGLKREEAINKLIKETAFTHLNRLVAFKLMEARGLVRSPLARRHEANGFKMWLGRNPIEEALYSQGDSPNERDGFGEAPRDRAYRRFLLWQCGELTREIKVLFNPDSLPSSLFPRPGVLKELIDALNADERKQDWAAGNEETVGWVYQYFNAEEKTAAFDRVFKRKKKFQKSDLPAATQVFTPRWIVKFLVENSLGRLWLAMHPDTELAAQVKYLIPLSADPPRASMKPVREIRILDPATGTMHFGLVAFDLLAKMYREEVLHAGEQGWPETPSVMREDEIPAAILANNLFGIDIDLRAVQLAALALYLKAKAADKATVVTESNLACADVAIFRGQHLAKITSEMALPGGVTRELFEKFRDSLEEASMMGSLVRLDKHFQNFQSGRLRQSIDAYVEKKQAEGVDESYFANETSKGIRLLNVLERRYDIIVTNPPYMSSRNMNPAMSEFMSRKRNYEKSKGDLYSAFIERCVELLADNGRLGMITQQSFMFISTCKDLRKLLHETTAIETMAHVGPRAFPEVTGEKVNATAFVLRREQLQAERQIAQGVYFRLVKEPDAESKRTAFEHALERRNSGSASSRVFVYAQRDFEDVPLSPWAYTLSRSLRCLFKVNSLLEKVAEPRQGLATADNKRFIRFWWEVQKDNIRFGCQTLKECEVAPERWYPHMKGGGSKRWHGQQLSVINYGQNGRELKAWADPLYGNSGWSRIIKSTDKYFAPGLTYTAVSGRSFSCRIMPNGFCFDSAGDCLFTEQPHDTTRFLGLLNSEFIRGLMTILNPTLNVNVSDLNRLPLPSTISTQLQTLTANVVALARVDSQEDEATYDFIAPPNWPDGVEQVTARHRDLAALEREIDEEVYRLYEVSPEDRRTIEDALETPPEVDDDGEVETDDESDDVEERKSLTPEDLGRSWVSYAVGIALGRFAPGEPNGLGRGTFPLEMNRTLRSLIDTDGLMVLQRDHPSDLAQRVIDILSAIHGDGETGRILRTSVGGIGDLRDALANYLSAAFFKEQMDKKRYHKRPVYWLLQSPKQNYSVYTFHERMTDQTLAVLQGTDYLGGRIFQLKQQFDEAKEEESQSEGSKQAKARKRAQQLFEELSDLEAFDERIAATNNEAIVNGERQSATAHWVPEFDDGILLNAAPLYRLSPGWKRADARLDLIKVWTALKDGDYPWAKTAMRYWPREALAACKDNKSYRIAHGLE